VRYPPQGSAPTSGGLKKSGRWTMAATAFATGGPENIAPGTLVGSNTLDGTYSAGVYTAPRAITVALTFSAASVSKAWEAVILPRFVLMLNAVNDRTLCGFLTAGVTGTQELQGGVITHLEPGDTLQVACYTFTAGGSTWSADLEIVELD